MPAPTTTILSRPFPLISTYCIGRSIELNVSIADDATETLGFILDEGAEFGGRARHHLGALLGDSCTHACIREDRRARAVERVDDRGWRLGRRQHAVPGAGLVIQSLLREGRH